MDKVTIDGWLARDKEGSLFVYGKKPCEKCGGTWIGELPTKNQLIDLFYLKPSLFPSVKWEDDEPTQVTITIEINDNGK